MDDYGRATIGDEVRFVLAVVFGSLLVASAALAHRIDEFLRAMLLTLVPDGVEGSLRVVSGERVASANRHLSEQSVYLVNAAAPCDQDVVVLAQNRNPQQAVYTLYFRWNEGASDAQRWSRPSHLQSTWGVIVACAIQCYSRTRNRTASTVALTVRRSAIDSHLDYGSLFSDCRHPTLPSGGSTMRVNLDAMLAHKQIAWRLLNYALVSSQATCDRS